MQTKLLRTLLDEIVEINRYGKYYAAFRYGINTEGVENLAIDIFKGDTNHFHRVITSNQELSEVLVTIKDISESKTKWSVLYSDSYIQIDEVFPNEALASSRAFLFKQKYNIDVTVKEFLDENM